MSNVMLAASKIKAAEPPCPQNNKTRPAAPLDLHRTLKHLELIVPGGN